MAEQQIIEKAKALAAADLYSFQLEKIEEPLRSYVKFFKQTNYIEQLRKTQPYTSIFTFSTGIRAEFLPENLGFDLLEVVEIPSFVCPDLSYAPTRKTHSIHSAQGATLIFDLGEQREFVQAYKHNNKLYIKTSTIALYVSIVRILSIFNIEACRSTYTSKLAEVWLQQNKEFANYFSKAKV